MMRRGFVLGLLALLVMTSAPAAVATFPGDNGRIAWSRDGDVFTMRADGEGKRKLTRSLRYEYASWSPDGRRLAVVQERAQLEHRMRILVMRADGSDKRVVASAEHSIQSLSWAPDGRTLTYCDLDVSQPELPSPYPSAIKVVHVATATETRLTEYADHACGPSWSPDSRRIAYTAGSNRMSDIFVMNADGTGVRQVTRGRNGQHVDVAWHPTRNRLAYGRTIPAGDADRAVVLESIRVDGTGLRTLSRSRAEYDRQPRWSPDGRRLLFFRTVLSGEFRILLATVKADGTDRRMLTRVEHSQAVWSPDSRRIAFSRDGDVFSIRRDGTGRRKLAGSAERFDGAPSWQAR